MKPGAFRDGELARALGQAIRREATAGLYRLMEFCGGHTHTLYRHGVPDLLPDNVEMVHGPGCPVCVLPAARIDQAIRMAQAHSVTLCTYGDLMRVPAGPGHNLLAAKAAGADIRMVYSSRDAVELAAVQPGREVVFFAIGFETTTPPTAAALLEAEARGLTNFSVFCNHVLTPAAMAGILAASGAPLDGFVGPGHVSTITGTEPYAPFAWDHGKPVVVAGFEPLDILQAILMLIRQVNAGRAVVENQYTRVVRAAGNPKAQAVVAQVFEHRQDFEWRGLGRIPASALQLRPAYRAFDAEARFPVAGGEVGEHRGCECGAVLRGSKRPEDCKLFAQVCTPENPLGACMVSSEGACAAHYTYARRAG